MISGVAGTLRVRAGAAESLKAPTYNVPAMANFKITPNQPLLP